MVGVITEGWDRVFIVNSFFGNHMVVQAKTPLTGGEFQAVRTDRFLNDREEQRLVLLRQADRRPGTIDNPAECWLPFWKGLVVIRRIVDTPEICPYPAAHSGRRIEVPEAKWSMAEEG
jgi:hypothetical protein